MIAVSRAGALALGLWVAVAMIAGFSRPAAAVEVEQVVSPGGIEAWLVRETSVPIVSMSFAFRGGAGLDPKGKEGLARLLSGLLDEGAGDKPSRAFQEHLEDHAINMSFNANLDQFSGSLVTLASEAEVAFDALGSALASPRFDADAVERVREQVIAGLARNLKNPDRIARRLLSETLFPDHVYGRPVGGTPDSVAAIEIADLRRMVAERLARDVLFIGVAGDIEPEALGTLLDRAFGALPEAAVVAEVAETTPQGAGALLIDRQPVPQSVVVFAKEGLKRDHPDFYIAYVMNHILGGGGFDSRLTEEIRVKRGLAYGVYSYLSPMDHAALVAGGAATQNARVGETLALIEAEIGRMRDEGVTEAELDEAKTYLTGSFPLRFDSNGRVADMMVGMQMADLGIDYIERRNGLIEAVTLEDVRRVAAEWLDPDALTVVIVGDPKGMEAQPAQGG